ncbi:hypothetical protein I5M07_07065 [Flavobacterium sp. SE-1-e]|uniref:Uncharacterized protein n=1 Tax=Flavobacterium agrisoli TaxID=2793066 RepID=A0A934PK18_9FLAO|nr:hypothetical protein [Flavobacterium agrisoli]
MYYVISVVFYTALLFLADFNFSYVGVTFLSAITLEFFISYLLLRPILENKAAIASTEKVSFIVVFFLFLIFQTILTARLLNEKH